MIILWAPVSPSGGRVPNRGEFVEAVCPCLTIIQNPTVHHKETYAKLMQTVRRHRSLISHGHCCRMHVNVQNCSEAASPQCCISLPL